jgi:molybdopterin-guanine dinucleotide biosynthesis protein A
MPCDLPFVTRAQIVRLTETFQKGNSRVVVAQTDDFFWHPLCSVVHIDVLPLVEEEMAAGHFKIAPVWHKAGHTAVPFDSRRPFININSPRDYADYLSGETPAGTGK